MSAGEWLKQQHVQYYFQEGDDDRTMPLVTADEAEDLLEAYAAHCLAEKEQQLERARQENADLRRATREQVEAQ